MASGTGIRLNGALSILLVMLLVLGGMASMSSLEMNDAAAAGDKGDDTADSDERKDASTLEKSESAWLERCKQMKNGGFDRGDWDMNSAAPLRDSATASGRQGDENNDDDSTDNHDDHSSDNHDDDSTDNHDDDSTDNHDEHSEDGNTDVDWHLPDNIEVFRTAYGDYVIRIVHDDGTVTEEVVTEEEFAEFLSNHGWDTTDEVEEPQTDRVEHDHVREEMVGLELEFLDDGTILITRTHGDWVEYEIIRTSEDGSTTVIRVSPRGTEVVHPEPARNNHHRENMGDRDRGEGEFAPLFSLAGGMDDGVYERCSDLMGTDKPTVTVDVLRIDRPDAERDTYHD